MLSNDVSSRLTINLKAISDNYQILQSLSNYTDVSAVVKANAYGLGVNKVAPLLAKAGCKMFFVATLNEAIELRKIISSQNIAVLNGIQSGQEELFLNHNLLPVLNSMYQIDICSNLSKKLPAILHVDTGMNRSGVSFNEIYKDMLSNISVDMIISHLACADEKNNKKNIEQLNQVKDISKIFPGKKISFCNSSGAFLGSDFHFDILRPGIALYGGNPVKGEKNPMHPVVKLTSKIIQIRTIDTDQSVGYGASIKLQAFSKIATVPIGYADGYFRCLGNKSYCMVLGHMVPVVGRVSMDFITLDITSIKEDVIIGDEVEIIGDNILIDDIANWAGTISYEILTNLGSRYERVYKY